MQKWISITVSSEYEDGHRVYDGKKDDRDLRFKLDYNTKEIKVFKRYREYAFIVTESEWHCYILG